MPQYVRFSIHARFPFIKPILLILCLLTWILPLKGTTQEEPIDFLDWTIQQDSIFQTSTIGALMAGLYDGDVTIGQLKRYGDFGVGTVNGLDGEMIALDGEFYQIRTDGIAYLIDDASKTPFANVTKFLPEVSYFGQEGLTLEQLKTAIGNMVPTQNLIYAFRISGTFTYIKTRSVPKQEKPYIPLVEVIKDQAEFEMNDVEGDIVGYFCPSYMNGVNVTGYHFHFITKDRKAGGHLLDCTVETADVEIDYKFGFNMVIGTASGFYEADLSVEGLDDVESPKSNLQFFHQFK